MAKKRRICVATGSRAEYGLLIPLLKALQNDSETELKTLITGAHLSPLYDNTVDVIRADGFPVDAAVDMELAATTPVAITKSVALGMIGVADALKNLSPDMIVVLGDRFEMLAVGIAALLQRLPIAHLHGGEVTAGAFDEAIRHSLTKMAHIHLVAAVDFAKRVIQLGEDPATVHVVGAPGLDNFRQLRPMGRRELEQDLGIDLNEETFLITYHPVTLERRSPKRAIENLLSALECFPNASLVFTGANPDTRSDIIYRLVRHFVAECRNPAVLVTNLGQRRYLSLMKLAKAVVGNSSSGIIEAPFVRTPTVNIGSRQSGRPQAQSIISCRDDRDSIIEALRTVSEPFFKSRLPVKLSLYGDGRATERIVEILKNADLSNERLIKRFHDIDFQLDIRG